MFVKKQQFLFLLLLVFSVGFLVSAERGMGLNNNILSNGPQKPFASRQGDNLIQIKWEAPSEGDLPQKYKIYRNSSNEFISRPLFTDGSFEEWDQDELCYWGQRGREGAITLDRAHKKDGNYSVRITNIADTEYNYIDQHDIKLQPNTDYILTGWIKGENVVQEGLGARIYTNIKSSISYNGTFDWEEIRIEFNSGSQATLSMALYLHQSTGTIWFDDVKLTPKSISQTPPEDYLIGEVGGNVTEFIDRDVDKGIRYYYTIAAIDEMGNAFCSKQAIASERVFYGENYFSNGSFEEWIGDSELKDLNVSGNVIRSDEHKVDGSYSIQLINTTNDDYSYAGLYDIKIAPQTDYVVIGWLKGKDIVDRSGSEAAKIYVNRKWGLPESGTFDWKEVRLPFNSGTNTTVTILCYLHKTTGTVWFDNVGLYKVNSIDGTPPEAPSNFSVTRINGTEKVELSWRASEVAPDGDLPVKYRIYRGDSPLNMEILTELPSYNTSWIDQGATGNMDLYYYVTALDAAAHESDPCEGAFVEKMASFKGRLISKEDSEPLSGANLTLLGTDLSLQNLADGTFEFEFVTIGDYTLLIQLPFYKSKRVTIELTPSIMLDLGDIVLELDKTPPNAPKNLIADGDTHVGLIDLTWDEPDPAKDEDIADSYNIYRALTSDVQRIQAQLIGTVTTTFFRDIIKTEDYGREFYYFIEAVDGAGNISLLGSNVASSSAIAPPIPTIISPKDRELIVDKAPDFEWEIAPNQDIYSFVIQISNDSSFPEDKTLAKSSTELTFTWPNQIDQSLWFWRVKAMFTTGVESGWSQVNEFIISTLIENTKIVPYINITPSVFRENKVIVSYLLTEEAEVQIRAYNLSGRIVTNLKSEFQAPGSYEVVWEGMDLQGSELLNGLYFVQLVAKSESRREKVLKKVVILR